MTMSSVKPTTEGVVGGLDRAALGRPPDRRLAGRNPPLELAHGLLDQLEGFLRRAVDDEGAQVRIGPSAARARSAGPDRRPGWGVPGCAALARATNRGGLARSVLTSLIGGRLRNAGT
jgi:hypothetical protein